MGFDWVFKEEFLCCVTYSICLLTELFYVNAGLLSSCTVLLTLDYDNGFFGGFIDCDRVCYILTF